MFFRKQKFGHGRLSLRLKPVVLLYLVLILINIEYGRADHVVDHSKQYYGRVQSLDPNGVTLLMGCSGNDARLIGIPDLEEVDFDQQCTPPKLSSRTSPMKLPCRGAHAKLFTVTASSGETNVVLTARSVAMGKKRVMLTLRNGRRIVGSSDVIKHIYYSDQCLRSEPDPVWQSIFESKLSQKSGHK